MEHLEVDTITRTDQLTEHVLGYMIDGWIEREKAQSLISLSYDERVIVTGQIESLADTGVSGGEAQRAKWAVNILGREVLSETARTVFIETASLSPRIEIKEGLGPRFGCYGRHSSPFTTGW
ncbi:MAG: hypothetical protein ABI354_03430 [Candidatus Saccharimonadales bacterium]